MIDLFDFIAPFKTAVLDHIKTKVQARPYYWREMRNLSVHGPMPAGESRAVFSTPEELLESGVSDDGLSVRQILKPYRKPSKHSMVSEIGCINGQPIYFIWPMGVYIWSVSEEHQGLLSLWLTFPAYPPGW